MSTHPLAYTLRAKKMGALIRDARLVKGKSAEACAQAIDVQLSDFTAYELGEMSPSLPELEILALFLEVPLEHFWGNESLTTRMARLMDFDNTRLLGLRQRMIGALICQARLERVLSIPELATLCDMSEDRLQSIELGQEPVTIPQLERIARILERPIAHFYDSAGPVGKWMTHQKNYTRFNELHTELQDFVSKPINRPYLEAARLLSEMPTGKLRRLAEDILEITL